MYIYFGRRSPVPNTPGAVDTYIDKQPLNLRAKTSPMVSSGGALNVARTGVPHRGVSRAQQLAGVALLAAICAAGCVLLAGREPQQTELRAIGLHHKLVRGCVGRWVGVCILCLSVCAPMCVLKCVCTCVSAFHVCLSLSPSRNLRLPVPVYACVCVCVWVSFALSLYTYVHIYIHVHMYSRTE